MSRLTHRFTSFLDQFSDRLESDCERVKRQLFAQVDNQFGVLRSKISELRGRFAVCGNRRPNRNTNRNPSEPLYEPEVETVSFDQWFEKGPAAEKQSHNAQSTSSGHKRKPTASQSQSTNNKRRKSGRVAVTVGPNKHVCKHPGCGKSFSSDSLLVMHEYIHLGIEPYSCSWPNCGYSAEQRGMVVRHVREKHFKLPRTLKLQNLLNIEDNRDPNEYVQVDHQLEQRRLE